jgi:hypothetical protein
LDCELAIGRFASDLGWQIPAAEQLMPRPPGFEPYTNLWVVRWKVNPSDSLNHAGFGVLFPRIQLLSSRAAADSLVAQLNANSGFNQFQVRSNSAFLDDGGFPNGATRYFNRKSFQLPFFAGLAESVQVQL